MGAYPVHKAHFELRTAALGRISAAVVEAFAEAASAEAALSVRKAGIELQSMSRQAEPLLTVRTSTYPSAHSELPSGEAAADSLEFDVKDPTSTRYLRDPRSGKFIYRRNSVYSEKSFLRPRSESDLSLYTPPTPTKASVAAPMEKSLLSADLRDPPTRQFLRKFTEVI